MEHLEDVIRTYETKCTDGEKCLELRRRFNALKAGGDVVNISKMYEHLRKSKEQLKKFVAIAQQKLISLELNHYFRNGMALKAPDAFKNSKACSMFRDFDPDAEPTTFWNMLSSILEFKGIMFRDQNVCSLEARYFLPFSKSSVHYVENKQDEGLRTIGGEENYLKWKAAHHQCLKNRINAFLEDSNQDDDDKKNIQNMQSLVKIHEAYSADDTEALEALKKKDKDNYQKYEEWRKKEKGTCHHPCEWMTLLQNEEATGEKTTVHEVNDKDACEQKCKYNMACKYIAYNKENGQCVLGDRSVFGQTKSPGLVKAKVKKESVKGLKQINEGCIVQ